MVFINWVEEKSVVEKCTSFFILRMIMLCEMCPYSSISSLSWQLFRLYTSLLSLFQDSDIQKKIDHEIRMRDGACKLLAACSQRDQALEAAKSLQTCSTRIMAYMSELQRMKEAQVMQNIPRRSSDAGPMDERLPCKGKVAISGM